MQDFTESTLLFFCDLVMMMRHCRMMMKNDRAIIKMLQVDSVTAAHADAFVALFATSTATSSRGSTSAQAR